MKAYIVKSQKVIEPFGDSPEDCLIANATLRSSQESILSDLNIEVVSAEDDHVQDQDEHLVLTDNLYFNRELMVKFLLKSRELKKKHGVRFTARNINPENSRHDSRCQDVR